MGDGAKERDRKGWEESGMNYGGSEGGGGTALLKPIFVGFTII